jgi:hypothetical protein
MNTHVLMNTKITLGIMTLSALTLVLTPVVVSTTFASFSGSQGQGHETTEETTCTNNGGKVKEGECGGNSAQSDNNDETTTTTTTAGKSDHIKDQDSSTR